MDRQEELTGVLALVLAMLAQPEQLTLPTGENAPNQPETVISATGEQLLAIAQDALTQGEPVLATKIYQALLSDPDPMIRNEARFRLAELAIRRGDWSDAGNLLRQILDSEPSALRARIELARVQVELGDTEAARRNLREAQAGQLPPDVARFVERFSAALRERKRLGGSIQLALAGDSNVNRATRADTLGTVIGDFEIDDDARQTSGMGVATQAEAYFRRDVGRNTTLLLRGGIDGNFYRDSRFNDVTALVSAGPEFSLGKGMGRLRAGYQRRWFGNERYLDTIGIDFDWQKPLGRRSQLRTGINLARQDFRLNPLQNGDTFGFFASFERALGTRTGVWLNFAGARQGAREPAYSTTSGSMSAAIWRDIGRTTLIASATYQRLEADRRLTIYPLRRREDFLRFSLGATLRSLSWRGWAPQLQMVWEKNSSTIEIYRYDRVRGEVGIVRAF